VPWGRTPTGRRVAAYAAEVEGNLTVLWPTAFVIDIPHAGSGPAGCTPTVPAAEGDRHIVVGGRRWRATDPAIPEPLRAELVGELMAARRAVRAAHGDEAATAAARRRVHDAKVALGERGAPWWEPAPAEAHRERVAATVRALLRHRSAGATICPSDVARAVSSPAWRPALATVRAVAGEQAVDDEIVVLQRGAPVPRPDEARGPIRYGRGASFPDAPQGG
jgi:hypothetical protein